MSFTLKDIGAVVEKKILKNPQLVSDPKNGDCFRACVTSLLGIPNTQDLPDGGDAEWFVKWSNFLSQFGLNIHYEHKACWRSGCWIASVKSLNFKDVTHAIIMYQQEVFFDPSPNNAYEAGINLLGKDIVQGGWYFEVEDFSKFIDAQASVRLRLNREKLLLTLMKVNSPQGHNFLGYELFAVAVADALIAADKDIVEVEPKELSGYIKRDEGLEFGEEK